MQTLIGNLTIGRVQSNQDNPRPIRIELTDESSGCRVVEIRLSLEDFTEATVGSRYVECQFDFNDSGRVGMTCERKDVLVPWKEHGHRNGATVARRALEPFETDGWHGRDYDYLNHHNRDGDNVRVHFERFVPREASE